MVGGDAPSGHLIWYVCVYTYVQWPFPTGTVCLGHIFFLLCILDFIYLFSQSVTLGGLQFILPAISRQSLPEALLIDLAVSG